MRGTADRTSAKILKILQETQEPLETKEIELRLKEVTRTKVLYRLTLLRGDGLVQGKAVGSGKGTRIWWRGRGP